MKNPCLSCYRRDMDKRTEECMKCDRRVRYVASFGSMSYAVPEEQTNLTGGGFGHGGNRGSIPPAPHVPAASREKKREEPKMEKTYVCTDPNCEDAGKQLPLKAFRVHPRTKKRMKICSKCFVRRQQAGRAKWKKRAKAEEKKTPPPGNDKCCVFIDFSGDKDLFDRLTDEAKKEFRRLEDHLYCILRDSKREHTTVNAVLINFEDPIGEIDDSKAKRIEKALAQLRTKRLKVA